MRRLNAWLLIAAVVAGCSAAPATSSPAISPVSPSPASSEAAVATPSPSPSASPRPALVGEWSFDRTCEAIVAALTKAGRPELIRVDVGETVKGNINGEVPSDWDPEHPCAMALPPTPHSHTFWPNGMFNSYDEHGNQVDDGPWAIVDDHTFTIGKSTFSYSIVGNGLMFEPVLPADCTGECHDAIWWVYAVSYPGSTWRRVTSGPHVP